MSPVQAATAAEPFVIDRNAPIGVFDSGIGGLSILRALRNELPAEHFVYMADSAYAPYGERSEAFVRDRSLAVTQQLVEQFHIKALVVACNSATACAIDDIRSTFPALAVIGVEPAVKPALQATRTGRIGVIGTRATLSSARFQTLLQSVAGQAEFVVQSCDGLATAIERSVQTPITGSGHNDGNGTLENATEIEAICAINACALGTFGSSNGHIDTLVLGCTHYLFAERELRLCTGPSVTFIEPGVPVALQVRRILERHGALRDGNTMALPIDAANEISCGGGTLQLLSTADIALLRHAAERWL
jgi:glutamate racemase